MLGLSRGAPFDKLLALDEEEWVEVEYQLPLLYLLEIVESLG